MLTGVKTALNIDSFNILSARKIFHCRSLVNIFRYNEQQKLGIQFANCNLSVCKRYIFYLK